MFRRIRKLLNEPAFQKAPLTVLGRIVMLAVFVALGRKPLFDLVPGVRIQVPADLRYTTLSVYLLRDEAEPELKRLDKFVSKGDVFIDIGANIGVFTLKAAPFAARAVAVEPGKVAGDLLEKNVALNDFSNITVVRCGLAEKIGSADLFHNLVGDDPQAFSLINDGGATETEQVKITTLDALVADLALPRVDCLKIDVEGAESRVIAGGEETLATFHPLVIFEMNCPALIESGGDPARPWNMLAELGYSFFSLQNDGTMRALSERPTGFCNVVARHPQGKNFAA